MSINAPGANSIDNGIDNPNVMAVGTDINNYPPSPPPSGDQITWGDGTIVTAGDGTNMDWSA